MPHRWAPPRRSGGGAHRWSPTVCAVRVFSSHGAVPPAATFTRAFPRAPAPAGCSCCREGDSPRTPQKAENAPCEGAVSGASASSKRPRGARGARDGGRRKKTAHSPREEGRETGAEGGGPADRRDERATDWEAARRTGRRDRDAHTHTHTRADKHEERETGTGTETQTRTQTQTRTEKRPETPTKPQTHAHARPLTAHTHTRTQKKHHTPGSDVGPGRGPGRSLRRYPESSPWSCA